MKNKHLTLLGFAVIFGWIMSLPYEGPVMYALAGERGLNGMLLNYLTVFTHAAGLYIGGFISEDLIRSKKYIVTAMITVLAVSLLMPFTPGLWWMGIIPVLSFITGTIIASFAVPISAYVPQEERNVYGADMLIYGNVVLIAAHIFANNTSPNISFVIIELILIGGIIAFVRTDTDPEYAVRIVEGKDRVSMSRFWIFFLFIFVISINSGIMFQVIYPYFSEHGLLVSLYTNVPYIAAIYVLSRRITSNKLNFLYLGLGLWVATFMIFSFVGPTELGFIMICTVMLGACGIFDFFWWSIMATNFSNVERPSRLLGTGLSLNVLGVWAGGILGNILMNRGISHQSLAFVGIGVVAVCMVIIMPLNGLLSELLDSNEFLRRFSEIDDSHKRSFVDEARQTLSNREYEVFSLLIQGKRDSEICKELHISPNTTKTHNRNIYKKLGVNSRVALIDLLEQ